MSTVDALQRGKKVGLRSVRASDLSWLYETASSDPAGPKWRLHGRTPSAEEFAALLWSDTYVQQVLVDLTTGEPIGLAQLYRVDLCASRGYFSGILVGSHWNTGWAIEGFLVFFDAVFRELPIRKIYMETPAYNLSSFASASGKFLTEEAILRDFEYYGGEYVDVHVLSLTRKTWEIAREKLPWISNGTSLPVVDGSPST